MVGNLSWILFFMLMNTSITSKTCNANYEGETEVGPLFLNPTILSNQSSKQLTRPEQQFHKVPSFYFFRCPLSRKVPINLSSVREKHWQNSYCFHITPVYKSFLYGQIKNLPHIRPFQSFSTLFERQNAQQINI
jgi:hypothetical protein